MRVKNYFEMVKAGLLKALVVFPSVCSDPCPTIPHASWALKKETTATQSKLTLTHTEHRGIKGKRKG